MHEEIVTQKAKESADNKANFRINISEINHIYYDPKKKWGMGNYPHDGKIYIETFNGKRKELIILGGQSGQGIVDWITNLLPTRQLSATSLAPVMLLLDRARDQRSIRLVDATDMTIDTRSFTEGLYILVTAFADGHSERLPFSVLHP